MTAPDDRDEDVLELFRARVIRHREAGAVHPLREYLRGFPEDRWDAIALEYARLLSSPEPADASQSQAPADADRLGPYRLEEEIGRGGQGIVYRATDTRLGRSVALKILRGLGPDAEELLRRFQREVAVTTRLDIPGICPVFDADVEGDLPYIAMRFIEGETLAQRIATLPDPPDGDAFSRIIEATARTLHAVHEAGVVHRDVKPGNIMITSDQAAVLMDFGLARDERGQDNALTRSAVQFGTPAYMSPEQLTGKATDLDRRTDVWSLSVTLYECVTRRRPFEAPTQEKLFQEILSREPTSPHRLNPALPKDLATVILTGLEKNREQRYQTALDLAEELRRVRELQPIAARPVTRWLRTRRWAQRNPALATALAGILLILILGTAVSTTFAVKARKESEAKSHTLEAWTRLADGRRLADLVRVADDELWPAVPSRIGSMTTWLDRAHELVGRLPAHEAMLVSIRAGAEAYGDEQREADRAACPEECARVDVITRQLEKFEHRRTERDSLESELDAIDGEARPSAARRRRRAAIERRLTSLERLLQETDPATLEAQRRDLEERIAARRSWTFPTPEATFRHERLRELVTGLRRLAGPASPRHPTIAGMERRLARARQLEARLVGGDAEAWTRCHADVKREGGPYGGLELTPIPGLVPLGKDRGSQLWEFWHVASGSCPSWDGEALGPGRVVLDPTSGDEGLVLVLLPGGTFRMGAWRADGRAHKAGAPNVDPAANVNESPVHDVPLAPFLASKYEVTQAQWRRLWNENPSNYIAGESYGTSRVTLRNPVEEVDWREVGQSCRRWDLALPTEAQWEYATRAGTSSPWSSGWSEESLAGFANLCDPAHARLFKPPAVTSRDDGHAVHAPVGSFTANGFGLHDVHGNLWEWCRDGDYLYGDWEPRPGDGLRGHAILAAYRIVRGGSYHDTVAGLTRSSCRFRHGPGFKSPSLGFRPVRSLRP